MPPFRSSMRRSRDPAWLMCPKAWCSGISRTADLSAFSRNGASPIQGTTYFIQADASPRRRLLWSSIPFVIEASEAPFCACVGGIRDGNHVSCRSLRIVPADLFRRLWSLRSGRMCHKHSFGGLPRQALWPSAHLVTAFSERACLGMLRVYSPTKSKRLHHQRECRRGLAAARVVEVIPRTRRTPIRENAHEPTLFHKSFHPIFRKIRKPKALKCRIPHQRQRVEDGATLDADFK